jgi:hypothetical protein
MGENIVVYSELLGVLIVCLTFIEFFAMDGPRSVIFNNCPHMLRVKCLLSQPNTNISIQPFKTLCVDAGRKEEIPALTESFILEMENRRTQKEFDIKKYDGKLRNNSFITRVFIIGQKNPYELVIHTDIYPALLSFGRYRLISV